MPTMTSADRSERRTILAKVLKPLCYLGIDPGVGGGIAVVRGSESIAVKMPQTERDVWECLLNDFGGEARPSFAVIEQQTPRPTGFFDRASGKWRQSILKSTCLLYGNYMLLRGMLVAAGIPFEDCPAKRWQKALNVPDKAKGEVPSHWKGRLKARAQQLHPTQRVTLATADALLIATYCQRKQEGRLG